MVVVMTRLKPQPAHWDYALSLAIEAVPDFLRDKLLKLISRRCIIYRHVAL